MYKCHGVENVKDSLVNLGSSESRPSFSQNRKCSEVSGSLITLKFTCVIVTVSDKESHFVSFFIRFLKWRVKTKQKRIFPKQTWERYTIPYQSKDWSEIDHRLSPPFVIRRPSEIFPYTREEYGRGGWEKPLIFVQTSKKNLSYIVRNTELQNIESGLLDEGNSGWRLSTFPRSKYSERSDVSCFSIVDMGSELRFVCLFLIGKG